MYFYKYSEKIESLTFGFWTLNELYDFPHPSRLIVYLQNGDVHELNGF